MNVSVGRVYRTGRRDAGELVDHRLHQRRVEGVRHGQRLRGHAVRTECGHDRSHTILMPRDDDRLGSVHGGNGDRVLVRRNRRTHPPFVGEYGRHGSVARQRLHQPAAGRHQSKGRLQIEDAGHAGRHVLPDAVPEDGVRPDAPRRPQLGERELEGEQCRLRVLGIPQIDAASLPVPIGIQNLQQRPAQVRPAQGLAAVEGTTEHRLEPVQLAPHAVDLRPLPGEQERHAMRLRRSVLGDPVGLTIRQERVQPLAQLFAGRAVDHQPMLEMRAAGLRREADIGWPAGGRAEERGVPSGHATQGLGRPSAQRQQMRRTLDGPRPRPPRRPAAPPRARDVRWCRRCRTS